MNASILFSYDSGIISPGPGDCDGEVLDHALVIVGYGQQTVNSQVVPYWIVRVSGRRYFGANLCRILGELIGERLDTLEL
jgi:hypothetical protein